MTAAKDATGTPNTQLEGLLRDNRLAVDEVVRLADSINKREWTTPIAEGKWSRAQHIQHVSLAYEALVRDVRDNSHARLIGTPAKRFAWRLLGLTQVLWLKQLPRGATSPREIRPPDASPVRAALLAELRERLATFEQVMRTAWSRDAGHRVMHPYFGPITLRQAIVLAAVHTRHHAAALTAAAESRNAQ